MNAKLEPPVAAAAMESEASFAVPLQSGTVLRDCVVTATIGQGGFGIVYRAEDAMLKRAVAIKEYLPGQLARRRAAGRLEPVSVRHAETYLAGLTGFVEEARLLARLRHPGLVEVHACWEENGTAYMSMPLYEGPTLERLIAARPGGLHAATLRELVAPLLGALATIHAAGCVHRDVSPDNVIVRPGEGSVLLDLGAARRVIGHRVRATTVMLKAGYAPIEQYGDDPECTVGPWSDVYALGALMHHAVTGTPPPASPLRMMRDTRVPLASRSIPGYEARFLEAIDAAMALRPEDRPRSMAALRERLGLPLETAASIAPPEPDAAPDALAAGPARRWGSMGAVGAAVAFGLTLLVWVLADGRRAPADVPESNAPTVVRDETPAVPSQPAAPEPVTQSGAAAQTTDAPATLRLAVVPWAEVWVDGTRRGVTPPLKTLSLPPGTRVIELRNPASGPVVRRINLSAGRSADITHRFEAPAR